MYEGNYEGNWRTSQLATVVKLKWLIADVENNEIEDKKYYNYNLSCRGERGTFIDVGERSGKVLLGRAHPRRAMLITRQLLGRIVRGIPPTNNPQQRRGDFDPCKQSEGNHQKDRGEGTKFSQRLVGQHSDFGQVKTGTAPYWTLF